VVDAANVVDGAVGNYGAGLLYVSGTPAHAQIVVRMAISSRASQRLRSECDDCLPPTSGETVWRILWYGGSALWYLAVRACAIPDHLNIECTTRAYEIKLRESVDCVLRILFDAQHAQGPSLARAVSNGHKLFEHLLGLGYDLRHLHVYY
jgi:hypothetical protein